MVGPPCRGSKVRVGFTCTDSGSGIRWCPSQVTLDTTSLGYHSVSFYAVDVAGITYTVVASGSAPMIVFLAPGDEWV